MGATTSVESATKGATSSAAISFLKSSPKKLLIGGKWVASKSGKTFETLNPSNEEVLALIAEGDKADVDEAVKNAAKFKNSKSTAPVDSKSLKKSQWKEKARAYWNPGGPIKVATISEFKNIFGEPSKTQSTEGIAFWYYQCSDGTIQIELIDPNMSGGKMLIREVNDY